MRIDRLPLFGGTALAERIERAEADLIAKGTRAALRRTDARGGFAAPDIQGVAGHEEFPREVIATAVRDLVSAAGVTRYAALCDGQLAGAASMRQASGIAQLTGAATVPAVRRRGSRARCRRPGWPRPRSRGARWR